jgi:hypothetical protein
MKPEEVLINDDATYALIISNVDSELIKGYRLKTA